MKKLLPIIILFSVGCSTVEYKSPEGHSFKRKSLGNKAQFTELEVISGDKKLFMKGYKSDQVQVIESAIKAGIEGAKKSQGIP